MYGNSQGDPQWSPPGTGQAAGYGFTPPDLGTPPPMPAASDAALQVFKNQRALLRMQLLANGVSKQEEYRQQLALLEAAHYLTAAQKEAEFSRMSALAQANKPPFWLQVVVVVGIPVAGLLLQAYVASRSRRRHRDT